MTEAQEIYLLRTKYHESFVELQIKYHKTKKELQEIIKSQTPKPNHTITLFSDVRDLDVPERVRNLLVRHRYHYIGEVPIEKEQLMRHRGIGNDAANRILDAVLSVRKESRKMTVLDIQANFCKPGVEIIFQPRNEKGHLPLDMEEANTDEEYSRLLNTKEVINFRLGEETTTPVYSISGRLKGEITRITCVILMRDRG